MRMPSCTGEVPPDGALVVGPPLDGSRSSPLLSSRRSATGSSSLQPTAAMVTRATSTSTLDTRRWDGTGSIVPDGGDAQVAEGATEVTLHGLRGGAR